MSPISDVQLLREYAQMGDEAAFSNLVARHMNLVYSAAMRQAESSDAAADIAQRVFIGLAANARSLAARLSIEASIAGWLCRCTRNVASNLSRDDFRRRSREKQAMEHYHSMAQPAADWERIWPILDDAMCQLGRPDFDALVLRYFNNQNLRDVGVALGVSDDAAQKRIARSLDKLRELLIQRGLPASSASLAAALSANAVQMAPAGMALSASSAAVFGANAVRAAGAAAAVENIMMTTFQKTMAVVATAAIVGAGIFQSVRASRLREENQELLSRQAPLAARARQLESERDVASQQLAAVRGEKDRLNADTAELLRLRGEVSRLKLEASKRDSAAKSTPGRDESEPEGGSRLLINNPYLARESWSDRGIDTPYHALETMLWAGFSGNTQRLAEVTLPGPNSLLPEQHPPIRKVKGVQIVTVEGYPNGMTRIGAIIEDLFYGAGIDGPPGIVQSLRFWSVAPSNDGWKVTRQDVKW
jgi:RNA polymerase sigma factor (sigma-70 family)